MKDIDELAKEVGPDAVKAALENAQEVPAPTAQPSAGVTSESVEKAKQKKKAQRETQLKAALITVPLDAYYDTSKSKYLVLNAGGRRLPLDTGQFKKRLQQEGFSAKTPEEGGLSPADTVTIQVQDHRDVCYAAPLAGRMAGFCEEGGHRFLVTDSPRFIPAVKGEWPTLRELLNNLFTKGEEGDTAQLDTVYTWLKGSIEALRAGRTKEAQCLAMAGPPQSGKSLFQKIITLLLGDRVAKPYLFLSGKTPFNAELFGAEHLMLEDEHMSNRFQDRAALAGSIKGIVANEDQHRHEKHCTGTNHRPFWRLTMTLNDEPEALRVIPPLDEHFADKIILLRASRYPLPMPTMTSEERAAFWERLESELPAFIHFLLHEYEQPEALRDSRYVVARYHHPALVRALHGVSPAANLMALIDQLEPWGVASGEWEGTAEKLRDALFRHGPTSTDARRLLEYPQTCGKYLATLAKEEPLRVKMHRTETARCWIITRPKT